MVLSPEDMQSLSQAADEALAEAKATRAMAASLMASLHPTEQAAVAATRPARTTVAAPAVKPAVVATPAVSKPTAATPAPQTIKLSAAAAAPASAKTPAPAATPQTIKVSAGTAAPAATRTAAPAPTVIPVLSPAPSATAAPAPASSKAPASVKKQATAKPRVPNVSTTLLRQALAQLPLRVAGIIGVVAVTAVAIANIAHHGNPSAPPVPAQTAAIVPSIPAAAPTSTDKAAEVAQPDPVATAYTGQPVRVKNPFDHSEVFEFPAGTSLKEARQSVSQILMQRAQDRGVPAFHATRADRHTVARSKPAQQQSAGLVQNSR